jgi:ribosomal protein S18 acetylase RimI-like enzyme
MQDNNETVKHSEVVIEEALPKDLSAFGDFCLPVFGRECVWEPEPLEWMMKAYDAHLYLMWHGTQIVGSTMVEPKVDGNDQQKPIFCLSFVGVHPEYRGKGLAKHLLRTIMKNTNVTWELDVYETNLIARNLYEKLGFLSYAALGLESTGVRAGAMTYRLSH